MNQFHIRIHKPANILNNAALTNFTIITSLYILKATQTLALFTMASNHSSSSSSSHGRSPDSHLNPNSDCAICHRRGTYTVTITYERVRPCDYFVGHCTIDAHTAGCQARFMSSGRTQRFCPCHFCHGTGMIRELMSYVERRSCSCGGVY